MPKDSRFVAAKAPMKGLVAIMIFSATEFNVVYNGRMVKRFAIVIRLAIHLLDC